MRLSAAAAVSATLSGAASVGDQLERDRLPEGIVIAHRSVDGAHTALRDQGLDPVRPDLPAHP